MFLKLLFCFLIPLFLQAVPKSFSDISTNASPAVVFIQSERSLQNENYRINDEFLRYFFPEGFDLSPFQDSHNARPRVRGQGSGFFVSKDGYILTNAHVLQDADVFKVTLLDGRVLEAYLVGRDIPSDLAVLKVEGDDFPFLELGDSDRLSVGEWVLAIGNPFGLSNSLTAGIVSAKGRNQVGISNYENFIQTDAAINPGNSGGPLLNMQAQVIGVNTAIFSQSGGYMGIGFAIPSNMALKIKDQLVLSGEVRRGYLGVQIQDINAALASKWGLSTRDGVEISRVYADSPAEKAGFKEGDLVLFYDGKTVKNVADFRNQVALTLPGSRVFCEVLRKGEQQRLAVKISELQPKQQRRLENNRQEYDALGLSLQSLDEKMRRHLAVQGKKGVLVSGVRTGSLADLAGIRPSAVIMSLNKQDIYSLADFNQAFESAKQTGVLSLLLYQNYFMRYVTIRF